MVLNQKKWSESNKGEGRVSTDGYLSFDKDEINSLDFVIKVEKREEFSKKFIHFTLIATTKDGNMRL